MKMKNKLLTEKVFTLIIIVLTGVNLTLAQNPQNDADLLKARDFIKQNRHIDALPFLEKAAPRYPKDAELQGDLGVAILVNSVTLKDSAARKKEIARAGEILKKAKDLGLKNVLALHYLDMLEEGLEIDSVSFSASKEVEEAIREGEGFFGRGEYDKAFAAYERAYKLDPKSYEAALFAGDCFYAQKKYKESEIWFARAASINPNREQAFRFWGDALANQGKTDEAVAKYADAMIAEPNSRLTFQTFIDAAKNLGARTSSPFILIPSKENESEIVIDETLLRAEDGTLNWRRFTETRKLQIEKFSKIANGREFSSTVAEDVEALKSVAAAAKSDFLKNKNLTPSKSLENLIKLDALGMLDVYTIIFIHGGDNSPEYEKFRENNREKMRKFFIEYFVNDKL